MTWTIGAGDWTRQPNTPILDGNFPSSLRPLPQNVVSMSLPLTTAGRLGFFIDYSERETVGTHTFYATRTHGSQGAVGCTWTAYDSADGAQLATGSLSWANHSLDIISFTVDIVSKPAGDHRIYVLLSNPTGGAVLHHGNGTVAYGIIDDDTIAESNAIFIDADAGTDGTGTQASPFNNWYSARDAVQVSTRFIYIKGMMIPNGTDAGGGDPNTKVLRLSNTFSGKTVESQRLVIRNWPSFVGGVDGGGQTDVSGFYTDDIISFTTFKGLSITNLNTSTLSTTNGKCYYLWTRGAGDFITTEGVNVDGIVTGATAANAAWFIDGNEQNGFKLWNTSFSNIDRGAVETYRANNFSVQKVTLRNAVDGIYQKSSGVGHTAHSVRFTDFSDTSMRFSAQSGSFPNSFSIVQHCIFNTTEQNFGSDPIRFDYLDVPEVGESDKHWIVGNVFYNYSFSTLANVRVEKDIFSNTQIFNNTFLLTGRAWKFDQGAPEYANFNSYWNAGNNTAFQVGETGYASLEALQVETSYEQNSINADPLFTDIANNNFTLQAGSPALTGGVNGTQQGLYLGDFYTVGVS